MVHYNPEQKAMIEQLMAEGKTADEAANIAADITGNQLSIFPVSNQRSSKARPGTAGDAFAKVAARGAMGKIKELLPDAFANWRDDQRAVANELARCALFSYCDVRKPRTYCDNIKLFSLGDGQVFYKGEELREHDELILVSLAHLARQLPASNMKLKVSSSNICKLNDWRLSKQYYDLIYLSIQRMQASSLTIISKRLALAQALQRAQARGAGHEELAQIYAKLERAIQDADLPNVDAAGLQCSLVREAKFEGVKDIKNNIPQGDLSWEIELDANMAALFARPWVTLVDARARKALSGKGARLQTYFSSHTNPYAIRLRSLAKLLGLQIQDIYQLKFILKKELLALKKEGVLADFWFQRCAGEDDWLVQVKRQA